MGKRTTPEDLADDVGKIVTVWKAHPEFILNDVTLNKSTLAGLCIPGQCVRLNVPMPIPRNSLESRSALAISICMLNRKRSGDGPSPKK